MQELDHFQLELGTQSQVVMMLALALMMFSVALGLKKTHFDFIRHSPRIFCVGVLGQLLVLPLLTLALVWVLSPIPSVALGMLLIACCPGGNVSNLLVLLSRGNTALSVSLTAMSSLVAAFFTPIAIVFWSGLYAPTAGLLTRIEFDALAFLAQTALILALPLVLGMLCAHMLPALSVKLRKPLVLVSSFLLGGIIIGSLVAYADALLVLGFALIGIVVLHNACAFLSGYLLACGVGAATADRRAITFEVGIQNAGLGIVILLTQLDGLGGAAAVVGLWGTWHIIAGLILVVIFRYFASKDEPAKALSQ